MKNNGFGRIWEDERRCGAFETRTVGNKIERNNSEPGDEVNEDRGQKKEGGKAGGEYGGSGHNPELMKEKRESNGGDMQCKEGDMPRKR